jgi:hypothetical protein
MLGYIMGDFFTSHLATLLPPEMTKRVSTSFPHYLLLNNEAQLIIAAG